MPATATRPASVSVELNRSKDTANTIRFDHAEPAEGEAAPGVRTLYLSKDAWHGMGEPESIKVTVEVAS